MITIIRFAKFLSVICQPPYIYYIHRWIDFEISDTFSSQEVRNLKFLRERKKNTYQTDVLFLQNWPVKYIIEYRQCFTVKVKLDLYKWSNLEIHLKIKNENVGSFVWKCRFDLSLKLYITYTHYYWLTC